MKTDLVATFTNSLGKEHDWTYKNVNADLPTQVIKDACELLTTLDIFEQNGVKLFDSVVTAKIVTTTETEIFDVKDAPLSEETKMETRLPKLTKEVLTAPASKIQDLPNPFALPASNTLSPMPEEPIKNLPSAAINPPRSRTQINRKLENKNSDCHSKSLKTQTDSSEHFEMKKGFLASFRRRKNRNKEDPKELK